MIALSRELTPAMLEDAESARPAASAAPAQRRLRRMLLTPSLGSARENQFLGEMSTPMALRLEDASLRCGFLPCVAGGSVPRTVYQMVSAAFSGEVCSRCGR